MKQKNDAAEAMTARASLLSIIGAIAIAAQIANFAYGAHHGATGRAPVECHGIAYGYAFGLWGPQ